MDEELVEAKRKLYVLLLEKPNSQISDTEADMLFALAQDRDMQNILNKAMEAKG